MDNDGKAELRTLIKKEFQRNKAKKKQSRRFSPATVNESDDEVIPKSQKVYRDRARERRRQVDDSQKLMHKGLDYSMLKKPRPNETPVAPPVESSTQDSEQARKIQLWLIDQEKRIQKSTVQNTTFEYDLCDKQSFRPLTIVRSNPTKNHNIPTALIALVAQTTRYGQPEFNNVDIFEDAGYYTTAKISPAIPKVSTTIGPTFFVGAKNNVKHRDPIVNNIRKKSQPLLAKNFDGTDLAYDATFSYDSDDETYSMAKARQRL